MFNVNLITEHILYFLIFFTIRLISLRKLRNTGCDTYNILLNLEYFRKKKKLPVKVGNLFMLENPTQWYPPGYLFFLSIFSQDFLKKNHWLVNHIFDFFSLLIFLKISDNFNLEFDAKILITIVYATSTCILNEFYSLNTRPIGLLIFNISIYLIISYNVETVFFLLCIFGTILFYTHKLSFQCLIFLYITLSIFININFFFILIGIFFISFLIWPSGFKSLSIAHFNILKFWHKNWNYLGSHIVRESIYYNDGKTNDSFYNQKENKIPLAYLKKLLSYNFFLVPFLIHVSYNLNNIHDKKLAIISILILILGIFLHWVKRLRFLGLGFQYIKYAFLPILIFISTNLSLRENYIFLIIVIFSVILHFRSFLIFSRNFTYNQTSSVLSDDLLNFIKKKKINNIMTLPTYNADKIAYLTKKKVYWGTHSEVFDERLNEFFPILKRKIDFYKSDGVDYILIDTNYVSPKEINLKKKLIFESKNFELFKV